MVFHYLYLLIHHHLALRFVVKYLSEVVCCSCLGCYVMSYDW